MQKIIKSFVSSLSGPHGTWDTQSMIYSDLNYTNEQHTGRIIYLLVWLPELHKKGMWLSGRNCDQPISHFSSRLILLLTNLPGPTRPVCLTVCIYSLLLLKMYCTKLYSLLIRKNGLSLFSHTYLLTQITSKKM